MFKSTYSIAEIKDEWDNSRWEAFVSDFSKSRSKEFQNYIDLAHYASFPIVLSSDLVYKIFINFIKPSNDADGEYPIWQASEFLFSPIVKEIGHDLYEIYPHIREALKQELKKNKLVGVIVPENIRIANFMAEYIEKCAEKIQTEVIRTAQYINYQSEYSDGSAKVFRDVSNILLQSGEKLFSSEVGYLLSWGKKRLKETGENNNLYEDYENLDKLRTAFLNDNKEAMLEALQKLNIQSENSLINGFKIPISADVLGKLNILTTENKVSTRKVYALIIGINKYALNPLDGCINDALSIENHLKSSENEPVIIKLLDENATKKAIIETFEVTLSQATNNDVVLFYFAGNGTTTLFSDKNQNVMSDSIVCYAGESNNNLDAFIISTQEVEFLFSNLASIHNTIIFDCCFTIDTARRAYQKKKYNNCRERAILGATLTGNRKSFISGEKISEGRNFFALYATEEQNQQSALEVKANGVFTKKLIEYLDFTGGEISYDALIGRVRQELKVKYDQRPIIKSNLSESELKQTSFLNRPKQGTIGELRFDNNDNRWHLNLGSIHGVRKSQKLKITGKNINKTSEITIDKVFSTYCTLFISNDGVNLDRETVYLAVLEGLELRELKIHVKHFNGNLEIVQGTMDKLLEQKDDHFVLENDEDEADYTLHIRNEKVYITLPNETYRPLIEPFELHHPNLNHDLVSTLRHLCKYHYITHMEGDKANVSENPLQIEIFKVKTDGTEEKLDSSSGKVGLDFEKTFDQWDRNIKISIKNQTEQNLYV